MAKFSVRCSVEIKGSTKDWVNPGEEDIPIPVAVERMSEYINADAPEYVLESYEGDIKVELLDPPPESVQVNLSDNLSLGDKVS